MDFVITVCDSAAGDACPVWPGHPSITHWGVEDPAEVEGSDVERVKAFVRTFQVLKSRIDPFLHLPLANLDRFTIGTRLQTIGHSEGASLLPASGADPHRR